MTDNLFDAKDLVSEEGAALAKQLADCWLGGVNGDYGSFDDIFEKVVARPDSNDIWEVAATAVGDSDKVVFLGDLYETAGNVGYLIPLQNGERLPIRLAIFTMIAQGIESDIQKLVSTSTLTDVVRQFRKTGFAHDQSNMFIGSIPLHGMDALDVSPAELRELADCMFTSMLPGADGNTDAIIQLLESLQTVAEPPKKRELVTRVLVGCRLLAGNENYDMFDGPLVIGDEQENEKICLQFERELDASRKRLLSGIHGIIEGKKLEVWVSGPYDWVDGLSEVAMAHVEAALSAHMALHGRSLDDATVCHMAADSDVLYLAVEVDGIFVGPISVPMFFMVYALEDLTSWAIESFEFVKMHDSSAEMLSAVSSVRH